MMNETKWNVFDDQFFIVGRRWFEQWKSFVAYDYVVSMLINQKLGNNELSKNKILTGSSNPGEVSNLPLLMEKKDFARV